MSSYQKSLFYYNSEYYMDDKAHYEDIECKKFGVDVYKNLDKILWKRYDGITNSIYLLNDRDLFNDEELKEKNRFIVTYKILRKKERFVETRDSEDFTENYIVVLINEYSTDNMALQKHKKKIKLIKFRSDMQIEDKSYKIIDCSDLSEVEYMVVFSKLFNDGYEKACETLLKTRLNKNENNNKIIEPMINDIIDKYYKIDSSCIYNNMDDARRVPGQKRQVIYNIIAKKIGHSIDKDNSKQTVYGIALKTWEMNRDSNELVEKKQIISRCVIGKNSYFKCFLANKTKDIDSLCKIALEKDGAQKARDKYNAEKERAKQKKEEIEKENILYLEI